MGNTKYPNQKLSYSENNHWWKPIEKEFTDISLKGLKVKCPICKDNGVVVSRWVKGLAEKPKYILHMERKAVQKVCKLKEEQTRKIGSQVKIAKGDIRMLLRNRKSFVLFSGGTDSLCLLAYLCKIAEDKNSSLTALYVDTTVGLPENIKYVRKVCRYLKVRLKIVRPEEDYFTFVKKWGIPSFKSRWCCRELKIKPIRDYLANIRHPKVVFDGIRAVESNVREKYLPVWYHPSFKCLSVSPIFYWSDKRKTTYLNSNGLPKNPLHSIGCSMECWCGAYKRKSDFEKLHEINRDMFRKLVKVEEQNRNGYTFLYKNGQRIPLKTLIKKND